MTQAPDSFCLASPSQLTSHNEEHAKYCREVRNLRYTSGRWALDALVFSS